MMLLLIILKNTMPYKTKWLADLSLFSWAIEEEN
jgi:hypothetical protein